MLNHHSLREQFKRENRRHIISSLWFSCFIMAVIACFMAVVVYFTALSIVSIQRQTIIEKGGQ